jgi:hypothetical protein
MFSPEPGNQFRWQCLATVTDGLCVCEGQSLSLFQLMDVKAPPHRIPCTSFEQRSGPCSIKFELLTERVEGEERLWSFFGDPASSFGDRVGDPQPIASLHTEA